MAISLRDVRLPSRFNIYSPLVLQSLERLDIYEHQREALESLQTWVINSKFRIALVVIPTGGGKSGIVALAPYVLNKTRVLVITPSLQITSQLAADFGREPQKSFYVKRNIVIPEEANMFVEPSRLISQGREMGDLAENLVIVNAQKFTSKSTIDWKTLSSKSFDLLIVDEAHHFPAKTWDKIVKHFACKTIFLTATPYHHGEPIVKQKDVTICYQISADELRNRGVIRRADFQEIGNIKDTEIERRTLLSEEIIKTLRIHDQYDPTVRHQAMVLTTGIYDSETFAEQLNSTGKRMIAASYTGDTKDSNNILRQFENGQILILVVCGKLLEGYDRKEISVCAIVRNVAPKSKVLFTQFVGRCLRKIRSDDPVDATIITHVSYKQRQNYDNLNQITEVDPDEDDENNH